METPPLVVCFREYYCIACRPVALQMILTILHEEDLGLFALPVTEVRIPKTVPFGCGRSR